MESFDIGRTFSRTWALLGQSITGVGLFVLITTAASMAVQGVTSSMFVDQLQAARSGADPVAGLRVFTSGWYWLTVLVSLTVTSFAFGGATFGILKGTQEQPAGLSDCAQAGIAKLGPILAIFLLTYIGVVAGLILLLVPGIIVALMWSVATPALLAENLGVLGSFGRSRALTKGSRGKIFLVLLLGVIVVYGVMWSVLGIASGSGPSGFLFARRDHPALYLVQLPMIWGTTMVFVALQVSIYLETLAIKGGGPAGHLDQVFA